MDRRRFILSGAALCVVGLSRHAKAARDPKLRAALDSIAQAALRASPTSLTRLGLDTGANASARWLLDDASAAARARTAADVRAFSEKLAGVRRASLDARDATLFDSVVFCLDHGRQSERFAYGNIDAFGGGAPYVVSQQDGAYRDVPEFLNAQHRIETKSDAEAYLARVAALGRVLDDETARVKQDASLGVVPPDFVLDTVLSQLRGLRATPAGSASLVRSIVRRTQEKNVAGEWGRRAAKLVVDVVYPALDRQIEANTANRSRATHDAGAWKLPDGEAYYAWTLEHATTTTLSPAQIHRMGLEQGAELDPKMDALLREQGYTKGTVAERLAALSKDPAQLFPNTDEGKDAAVAYVQHQMDALRGLLPRASNMQLAASVTVKRVPSDIEAGAPLGYMSPAALDGSRPAIYYINLRDASSWPKFTIPSLSAHEGLPGHSWQFAYLAEHRDEVPLISSVIEFNAFSEGWALYAEQLVDELGLYARDPLGRLGMYQAMRFRASRLVVDTGLHAMRWTREKAVEYLHASTGRAVPAVTSEVDRYCVSPGQACGYKVGHTEIVRLRDKARSALGARFDVREFDDVLVRTGGVPLTVLATVVDDYITRTRSPR